MRRLFLVVASISVDVYKNLTKRIDVIAKPMTQWDYDEHV